MSDGMKLTDFPLVTSLDTTDTVLATDVNGAGKRISKTNLRMNRVFFNSISSPTWVRVAQVNSAGWALMKIFNAWLNVPGNNILLDMQLHPNSESYNHVTVLSRTANSPNGMLQKMRVVRQKGGAYYIDIYYNANTAEQVYVYLIDSLNVTLLTPEPDAEIPEGYTAVEFDISKASWGGVKRCATNSCKLQQKGGQRNDRGDKCYRAALESACVSDGSVGRKNSVVMPYIDTCFKYGFKPVGTQKNIQGFGNIWIRDISVWRRIGSYIAQRKSSSMGCRNKHHFGYRCIPSDSPVQRRSLLSVQRGGYRSDSISVARRKEVVAA